MLEGMGNIAEIDQHSMREILEEFPEQCINALKIVEETNITSSLIKEKPGKVLVCGLGGSAIGGEVLQTLFTKTDISFTINRNYHLPSFVDRDTLTFVVSYSGNTEETISSFKEAVELGCPVFSISSGGELEDLAGKHDITHIKVPEGMPPRCAMGYLSLPMIRILEKIHGDKLFDYEEMEQLLSEISERYLPQKREADNPAKSTARRLVGKIPLIYGVDKLTDVVAHRLKTQFNENSKILAFWDVLPELNHNEVVPWSGEGKVNLEVFYPIFIRDKREDERIKRRVEVTQELIKQRKIGFSEIWTEGENLISRILSAIYIGDWISFYLAMFQEVDPTPVRAIDLLKAELARSS